MTATATLSRVEGLPAQFQVHAPDNALPEFLAIGELGEFDSTLEPRDGDAVLIRVDGEHTVRKLCVAPDGEVTFAASSAAPVDVFPPISSRQAGVVVLAVLTYLVMPRRPASNAESAS